MDKLFENVGGNQFKVISEDVWPAGGIDASGYEKAEKERVKGMHGEKDMSNSEEKLTFINGENSECGCEMESKSGGGQYSDAVYIRLCHIHKSK